MAKRPWTGPAHRTTLPSSHSCSNERRGFFCDFVCPPEGKPNHPPPPSSLPFTPFLSSLPPPSTTAKKLPRQPPSSSHPRHHLQQQQDMVPTSPSDCCILHVRAYIIGIHANTLCCNNVMFEIYIYKYTYYVVVLRTSLQVY